jgi:hypothetical protein
MPGKHTALTRYLVAQLGWVEALFAARATAAEVGGQVVEHQEDLCRVVGHDALAALVEQGRDGELDDAVFVVAAHIVHVAHAGEACASAVGFAGGIRHYHIALVLGRTARAASVAAHMRHSHSLSAVAFAVQAAER